MIKLSIKRNIKQIKKFLFLFLFFSIAYCNKMNDKQNYPVKIEKIHDLITIQNPSFPKASSQEFILQEELSIGNENDENYFFQKIRKIAIDDEMNLYILDSKKCRVQVFDRQGLFLRTIGNRPGNGPGEMGNPIDLILDKNNNLLHILDNKNRKIIRCRLDGTFDRDIKLNEGSPGVFFLGKNGSYIVIYSFLNNEKFQENRIITYTQAGKKEPVSRNFIYSKSEVMSTDKGLTVLTSTPFDPKGCYAYCQEEGYLYYGFADKYELIGLDAFLNTIKVIKKQNAEKMKISTQEKEIVNQELKESFNRKGISANIKVEFPDFHPLFTAIWTDDNQEILVCIYMTYDEVRIDVFNKEGIYIEKRIIGLAGDGISLKWIFSNPIFKNGCLYAVVNDDNLWMVKKYRMIEKKKE